MTDTKDASTREPGEKRRRRPATPLSVEVIDTVVAHIEDAAGLAEAARLTGVAKSTVFAWQAKGRDIVAMRTDAEYDAEAETDHDVLCAEFAERVALARAKWKAEAERSVWEAGVGVDFEETTETIEYDPGDPTKVISHKKVTKRRTDRDWRATVALLQARYPKEWKAKAGLEVTGADGGPVVVDTAALRAEADQLLADLQDRLTTDPDAEQ